MAAAQGPCAPPLSIRPPNPHPDPDPRYNKLSDIEKQDWPWQYCGYRELSKWMGSSNDFFVLRKFSALNARALLHLQNEITKREQGIEDWDQYSMQFPIGKGGCGSFQKDEMSQITNVRVQLLRESIPLLKEYYEMVNAYASIKSKPTATQYQRNSLLNWYVEHPHAFDDAETSFLERDRQRDLFPVVAKPRQPLSMLLEKAHLLRRGTHYQSATGLDIASSIVVVMVGLGLLFGPMWWLNYVSTDPYRLSIITGFVSSFATLLWIAAGPRPFEILAGTAAYAAVLMVFMQVQKDP